MVLMEFAGVNFSLPALLRADCCLENRHGKKKQTSKNPPLEPWFGESSSVIPPMQKPRPERELRLGLAPGGPSGQMQYWLSDVFSCLHV